MPSLHGIGAKTGDNPFFFFAHQAATCEQVCHRGLLDYSRPKFMGSNGDPALRMSSLRNKYKYLYAMIQKIVRIDAKRIRAWTI
jgi:hypothetical protein